MNTKIIDMSSDAIPNVMLCVESKTFIAVCNEKRFTSPTFLGAVKQRTQYEQTQNDMYVDLEEKVDWQRVSKFAKVTLEPVEDDGMYFYNKIKDHLVQQQEDTITRIDPHGFYWAFPDDVSLIYKTLILAKLVDEEFKTEQIRLRDILKGGLLEIKRYSKGKYDGIRGR